MSDLHFILQGKGGCGKTLAASLLAQYFASKDRDPVCLDNDPVNPTFSAFKALNVERLAIMNGDVIDPRAFDQIAETVSSLEASRPVVIDNGAAGFIPLCAYVVSNDIVGLFKAMGHTVFVHTLILGGQSLSDTLSGYVALAEQLPEAELVVWMNEFFGVLEHNGKTVEELPPFRKHADRIHAVIPLPTPIHGTFSHDLGNLLRDHLTFAEGIAREDYSLMTRHRLKRLWGQYVSSLEQARL